jgi:N-acetylglucosamine kinase-like BadF-type ATPase
MRMSEQYIIGIDGGGTKTRGVITDLKGEVLGYTVVGSSNYHALGLEAVEENLRELLETLAPGDKADKIQYVCLGLSGVGRPIDHERIGSILEKLNLKDKYYLTNDAVTALIGGALAELGILIIAGTGSIVYGMDGKGNMARAGGFGQYLADEGSGYRIGLKGLISIMKGFDGRIEPPSITDPVLKKLGLQSPMELVTWIGGQENMKEEVGKIGPFVLEAAEKGDKACLAVVEEEIQELVEAVKAVTRRLGVTDPSDKINVVMVGGVLENSEYYFNKLQKSIDEQIPQCTPIKPKASASVGAVMAAMKKAGIEPTEEMIKSIIEGIKEAS